MNEQNKPNFDAWSVHSVIKIAHELWDDNMKLRAANEQLRVDNKDLLAQLRRKFMTEEDLK